jgi:hypothetical protein
MRAKTDAIFVREFHGHHARHSARSARGRTRPSAALRPRGSARLARDIVTVNRNSERLARGLDDGAPSASDWQVRDGHAVGH